MAEKVEVLDKRGRAVEGSSLSEKLFFLERYYYKNRKKIIFSGVIILLGAIGYLGYTLFEEYRSEVVNKAYYNYERGIEPEANLKIIEENSPRLLSLIQFSEAISSSNLIELEKFKNGGDTVLSDIASYQVISLSKDTTALNSYSYSQNAIFRDLAIVSEAYSLIESGKVDEAKNRLSFIEDGSSLQKVANLLKHYGVTDSDNNSTIPEMSFENIKFGE
jgi:predicted negative regulator of RcsB-dependent stress response